MSPERLLFLTKLKVRKLSPRTIYNYEQALLKLARHYNKSPLTISTEEIERYLLYELEVLKLAPATVNLHIGAFKKFFELIEPHSTVMKPISKVKDIKKLPSVLTTEMIVRMVKCTDNLKHRALIELLYSSGIRLNECINLRPRDIDGKNMLVHVVWGKVGKNDTPLSVAMPCKRYVTIIYVIVLSDTCSKGVGTNNILEGLLAG